MPPDKLRTAAMGMQQMLQFLGTPEGAAAYNKYLRAMQNSKMVTTDVAKDVIMAITGSQMIDEAFMGDLASMANPHARRRIGASYIKRAQNKTIAILAVTAAVELKGAIERQAASRTNPRKQTYLPHRKASANTPAKPDDDWHIPLD
jgi:hypothetical protein